MWITADIFSAINSPVYGIIFLFKYGTEVAQPESANRAERPLDGTYDYSAAENIFFASQVIQNACGTQALLSVLLNKDFTSLSAFSTTADEPTVDIGDPLRSFLTFTQAFPPDLRGETLTNSDLIRTVHNSFSRSSVFSIDQSMYQRPSADEDELYHFIAYTPINNVLYELDGLSPAPISHGECGFSDFPRKVVDVIRRRIERYPATEIRFNVLAMVRDRRIVAREIGDSEGLEREEARRRDWGWENALRAHNFLGFAGEVLKGVASSKMQEGKGTAYDEWVANAVKETERKVEFRRGRRSGAGADAGGGDMDID